ncbi:efflux RND transporter periplasmic adaptor subunit [Rhodopirellula sp. P2]|uniref:efflux RND transporter periplasmic adaptor subunit n=1 Tax=Rhodopirellula sp. P2 TaxID=2127060 RepID=UPI0023681E2B|nr:efflux RND transporter periplasmic adaptor subunit [Rhodopirellula sp. P2]WDQ17823.1 efflux RND transporter periplasmic adaptor subunit [Rhodopirellula sp. P2]
MNKIPPPPAHRMFARGSIAARQTNGLCSLASLLLAPLCLLALTACTPAANEYQAPPPPDVTTANPVQQSLTIFIEENGETEAVEQADVRARVGGFVEELSFEPGQFVSEDQELYRIEPDTYQANRNAAAASVEAAKAAIQVSEAALASALASVQKAENDLKREQRLKASNAGSQATFDAAVAARDSAMAQSKAAEANIEADKAKLLQAQAQLAQAELDLKYTVVRAPIEGRVSKTQVKLGNLVQVGSTLATIVDQRKIFANFSISDRKLLELVEARPETEEPADSPEDWSKIPVYLQRDGDSGQWLSGKLDYVDQRGIDQKTGTFGLRADFDNEDGKLLPGMFVIIRLPVREVENAILIPERAIVRNQTGSYVMLVDSENQIEQREIMVGQTLDGWALIKEGLSADDTFVLEGLQRARPGSKVSPKPTELSTQGSPMLQAAIDSNAGTATPGAAAEPAPTVNPTDDEPASDSSTAD